MSGMNDMSVCYIDYVCLFVCMFVCATFQTVCLSLHLSNSNSCVRLCLHVIISIFALCLSVCLHMCVLKSVLSIRTCLLNSLNVSVSCVVFNMTESARLYFVCTACLSICVLESFSIRLCLHAPNSSVFFICLLDCV